MNFLTRRQLLAASVPLAARGKPAPRRNVLLVCVDDLRPWLGCYGEKWMKTPNLDRLSSQGRRFTRHYVQSAVCGPSRCTLLTGRAWNDWDCWREARQNAEPEQPVSLAHLLRRAGYETASVGKVSHQPSGTMDNEQKIAQVPFSWDRVYTPVGEWRTPWRAFFGFSGGQAYNNTTSLPPQERDSPRPPWEAADVPDEGYPDGLIAKAGISELERLSRSPKPFFLAAGFFKPHLPFTAPKRYWDLYRDSVPPAPTFGPAQGTDPTISLHRSGELTNNHYWPAGPGVITAKDRQRLRHAYAACVSYSDAQIGKLLRSLDRLGLRDSTIVAVWSDHGWHLGEHGIFGKHTNHEVAVRSPLIIRMPGQSRPGVAAQGLAETLDLYPTIAEYCGARLPGGLQGRSLMPALRNPEAEGKPHAFSFYPRGKLMGRTVRTERWRLVVWTDPEGRKVQQELYDHVTDPDETVNRAAEASHVVARLMREMPPMADIVGSTP